jgi:hypothetical protein
LLFFIKLHFIYTPCHPFQVVVILTSQREKVRKREAFNFNDLEMEEIRVMEPKKKKHDQTNNAEEPTTKKIQKATVFLTLRHIQ